MKPNPAFIDYYEVLRVWPTADLSQIKKSYFKLAKLYHPDSPETADVDRFTAVVGAYGILRNPEERAEYDRKFDAHFGPERRKRATNGSAMDETTAASDADIHGKILLSLYKKRREKASDAGIAGWLVQEGLGCSDDEFEFHVWYLRAKGFVDITEQGTLAITIAGVDHVIASAQASVRDKLRIAHLTRPNGIAPDEGG